MKQTTKTSFVVQLVEYGFWKIIFSFDFICAVIIFIVLLLNARYGWGFFIDGSGNELRTFTGALLAISSTMFSITLAALAIILSFSTSSFMRFLRKHEKMTGILFPFWLGNLSYLLVVLLTTVYLMLKETTQFLDQYLFPLICALFIYSVLGTFYLLSTIIKFGYFAERADEQTEE